MDHRMPGRQRLSDAAAHGLAREVCAGHCRRGLDAQLHAVRSACSCSIWLIDDALAQIEVGGMRFATEALPWLHAVRGHLALGLRRLEGDGGAVPPARRCAESGGVDP